MQSKKKLPVFRGCSLYEISDKQGFFSIKYSYSYFEIESIDLIFFNSKFRLFTGSLILAPYY